jgi:hypothetical protein
VRGTEIVAEEQEFISRRLAIDSSFREIGRLLKRDHTALFLPGWKFTGGRR